MNVARIGVELVTGRAGAAFKKLQSQANKLDAEVKKLVPTSKRVEASFRLFGKRALNSLRDIEGGARRVGNAMGGLRGTVAKLAVGFLAVQAAQAGIARAESQRRIKFLARSYGEMAELQAAATASAEKFGLGQTEANNALANTYARLRPVGVSLKDITSIYNGFNTVARLSGATSVEASNAFTQLAQALGSGALRGDEFNSIAEQVPGLLTAISKETGVAQGGLRKYAAEGKITSDVVLKALKRIEKEGAGQLKEALGGPQQAIKEFQNATENVQIALTQDAIPEITKSFKILAEIITDLKPVIRAVGSFAAQVLGGVAATIERIRDPGVMAKEQQAFFAEGRMRGRMRSGQRGGANLPADYAAQEAALFKAAPGPVATPTPTPTPTPTIDSSKAAKERLDITQKMFDLESRLIEVNKQGFEREAATLKLMIERQRIAEGDLLPRETALKLLEAEAEFLETIKGLDQEIAENRKSAQEDAQKAFKKFMKAEEEATQKRLEADPGYQMQQQLEKLLDTQNQAAFAAQSMGNAFANAFGAVVTGAKSGQEALAGMLKSIAADFLGMAKKIIAQQLTMILYGTIMKALGIGGGFNSAAASPGGSAGVAGIGGGGLGDVFGNTSSFGTFAEGGYVNKPTNALIGEGGEPEYVIPESKMRESMSRYSRGSRGGGVIPSDGGSSASGDGGTAVAAAIDVRYTVERINSVDYVTADQFQSGMQSAAAQGAQRGEQNTLKRIQMSGGTRKRLGL